MQRCWTSKEILLSLQDTFESDGDAVACLELDDKTNAARTAFPCLLESQFCQPGEITFVETQHEIQLSVSAQAISTVLPA